jgi:dsRNA-specific ribonuclease
MANNTGKKFGGREAGTPNRTTIEIKTAFQNLLDSNIDQMDEDLKALQPKERLNVLLKLADFVLPKIQSVQPEGFEGDNKITIEYI